MRAVVDTALVVVVGTELDNLELEDNAVFAVVVYMGPDKFALVLSKELDIRYSDLDNLNLVLDNFGTMAHIFDSVFENLD